MFRYLLPLLVVAYLLTGLAQVGPEERAVVRRFGRVVARPGPGLWVGLPWGFETVDRVPVRTARQLTVGYNPDDWSDRAGTPAGQYLTGDQNLVNVQLVLDYGISESDRDLDDYVNHRDRVDAVLGRLAEGAAAEWVAGRGVDLVLMTGNASLPAWVMDRVTERLPQARLGIRLQRVSVGYLAPPEEVRAAFEAVTQAQTNIRTREFQARQEASQRERYAEAMRYKLEQEASQYRDAQLGQARADADAFLRELASYRQLAQTNPDARAFIWWQEMREALAILESRGGKVKPLDQYLQNGELTLTETVPTRDGKR